MGTFDDWDEQGPPELLPVPEGRRNSPTTLIVVGAVVAGILVTGVVAWAVSRTVAPPPRKPAGGGRSNTVTESFVVTGPSGADTSTVVTEIPTSGPPAESTSTVPVMRLAYRVGDDVWVADEAGGHAKKVLARRTGPFALSPDGKTLALVDARARRLDLVDVATSRVTTVSPADAVAPVWSPNSSWLAFQQKTAGKAEIHRCSRTGDQLMLLALGDRPSIAADGRTYAYVSRVGRLTVVRGGETSQTLSVAGRVDDVALIGERVVYALGGQARGDLSIHSAKLDGTDDRLLVGAPVEETAGSYGRLLPDPSGMWLAYSFIGDDGFSALKTVRLDGSRAMSLSGRRSDYPLRWSNDATRLFFIEGNADQGQDTSLLSARPDGTQRTTVVVTAGL